jgi:hypothetical protein
MSILDALRVQKSGQKSVQELSQLPQQQIMQMAQMGQIPADVVPVIISEKARLAQQAAQAQAMQNPQLPSVMDQAMQVNAQHEQQGLPAIPTPGMFQEQNYQAGGIVGYAGDGAEGQQVKGYQPDEINALADGGLGKYVQQALAQQRAINAAPIATSQAEQDLAAMLRSPPADENRMMWLSLLKGGLKGLAGTSPYAAVNLGQGLGEAAQSYEEGLKEQQKNKLAYAKEMADQARAQRQEGLGALTLGAKLKESEDSLKAALARAAKEGDMNTFIRIAVTAARERGDKTPDSILSEAAAQNFIKLKAAMDPRMMAASAAQTGAGAQVTQADVARERVTNDATAREEERKRKTAESRQEAEDKALKRFEERWENARLDPAIKDQLKEAKKSGPAAVEALRNKLEKEALSRVGLANPNAPSTPTGLFSPKVKRTVTQAEIDATAKKYGISAQQVKDQLGIQ